MKTKDALAITVDQLNAEVARLLKRIEYRNAINEHSFDNITEIVKVIAFLKNTLPNDLTPKGFVLEQDEKGRIYPVKI